MIGDVYKLDIALGEVLYVKELETLGLTKSDCLFCPLTRYCSGEKATGSIIPKCNIHNRFVRIEREEYELFRKRTYRM